MMLPIFLVLALGSAATGDTPSPSKDKKAHVELPADVAVAAGTPRAWVLMAASVPAVRHNFPLDALVGGTVTEQASAKMREVIEQGWKVKNHDQLVKVLDNLEKKGAREDVEKLFQQTKRLGLKPEDLELLKDEPEIKKLRVFFKYVKRIDQEKEGLLALDLVTVIDLSRMAYIAGYLTEQEFWKRLDPVAKKLQKAYDSWEDLGEIYSIGLEVTDEAAGAEAWKSWNKLKSQEKGPWSTVDWKLKLDGIVAPAAAPVPAK